MVTWVGWTVESGVDALPAVRRRGGVGLTEFMLADERTVLVGDYRNDVRQSDARINY